MKGPRVHDPKRRIIRVRLNEGLYQRMMDHAEKTQRSISEITRAALREWIKKEHGS